MIKCDGCLRQKEDWMFHPVANGETYQHLGFKNVCNLCQVQPRECTKCHQKFPANGIWFYSKRRGFMGLHSIDKECSSKRSAQHYQMKRLDKEKLQNEQPAGF